MLTQFKIGAFQSELICEPLTITILAMGDLDTKQLHH